MHETDEKFAELMKEVVEGSEDAAKELLTDFEAELIHAIRRRMHRKMRSRFDSLDFAQDVWASFFARPAERRTFDSPDQLISFLTKMAEYKIVEAVRRRRHHRKSHMRWELSLDDSRAFEKEELVAEQNTPSQAMSAEEEWRIYLSKQPPVYCRIFILLRQGMKHEEIAEDLGISVRTVYRAAGILLADWIL